MDEINNEDNDDDDLSSTDDTLSVDSEVHDDSCIVDNPSSYIVDLGLKMFKCTGRVFASIFTPTRAQQPASNATRSPSPQALFRPALTQCSSCFMRFINTEDPKQVLVYTDGACLNNGQANPRAG